MNTYPTTAEGWFSFLLDNEAAEGCLEALETWRRQNPQNGRELDLLQRGWEVAEDLVGDSELLPAEDTAPGARRPWIGWRSAAAAMVAVVVLALFWPAPEIFSEHRTTKGEQNSVVLKDGTEILLNTDTALDIASSEQNVYLRRGEAYFTVSPRHGDSFTVDAGQADVKVIGTQFNVFRHRDDLLISVSEGQVEVEVKATDGDSGESFELTVGQTLEIDGREGVARLLSGDLELERVEAWRAGKIELDHTSLSDAVAELSRYTPIVVEIAEPRLGALEVSGVFRIDRMADLDALIFALESSLPIEARQSEDKLELFYAD